MTRDLKPLKALAEMVRTDEMARLGILRSKMADLSDKIASLRSPAPMEGDELGYLGSGGDAKWQIWRQQEIGRLNRTLATLRAEEQVQEQKTRVAVARTQVLTHLLDSALKETLKRGG